MPNKPDISGGPPSGAAHPFGNDASRLAAHKIEAGPVHICDHMCATRLIPGHDPELIEPERRRDAIECGGCAPPVHAAPEEPNTSRLEDDGAPPLPPPEPDEEPDEGEGEEPQDDSGEHLGD